MNIDELTLGQLKEIQALLGSNENKQEKTKHPMLGRRCLIRCYSAGVHIGTITYIDGMECKIENCLRLYKWEDGGLSLSAIATNGIVKGRLNRCAEDYLLGVIEMIPITEKAEKTMQKWIEDEQ